MQLGSQLQVNMIIALPTYYLVATSVECGRPGILRAFDD